MLDDMQALGAGPSPADAAAMDRDGYLVVRGFFGANEVADVLAWTEEVSAATELPGRHMV